MTATAHVVADGRHRWLLDLPAQPTSTPNSREHWAAKARKAKAWREAVHLTARAARVPACDRVRVGLDHWPRDRRRRDPDNLMLVLKWCLDGLRDAGVVADDTGAHVDFGAPVIHEPRDDRAVMWLLTVEAA